MDAIVVVAFENSEAVDSNEKEKEAHCRGPTGNRAKQRAPAVEVWMRVVTLTCVADGEEPGRQGCGSRECPFSR
jgi:hypothetical protein